MTVTTFSEQNQFFFLNKYGQLNSFNKLQDIYVSGIRSHTDLCNKKYNTSYFKLCDIYLPRSKITQSRQVVSDYISMVVSSKLWTTTYCLSHFFSSFFFIIIQKFTFRYSKKKLNETSKHTQGFYCLQKYVGLFKFIYPRF